MVPELVETGIHEVFGSRVHAESVKTAGGGCINTCYAVSLSNGITIFVKENTSSFTGLFKAESKGLKELGQAGGPKVPRVLHYRDDGKTQLLFLEYLESGPKPKGFYEHFGRGMAELHRNSMKKGFGFETDNHIGSTVQYNPRKDTWLDFFVSARITPQKEMAEKRGLLPADVIRGIDQFIGRIGSVLLDDDTGSLIHGDLWGGNYMCDGKEAVLIDPAVSYSHREADLAMTELFGGFSEAFYGAYREAFPLDPGYEDRIDAYNLYHMLNHLNIFGTGYLGSVASILRKYGCL